VEIILLLGGAGILLWGLLAPKGVSLSPVDQGANNIETAGNQGISASAAADSSSDASKTKLLGTATGAIGGGASAGVAVGGSAGAAAGAVTAAVTAGIGIAIGVAIVLWQKHQQRIKDAKTENAAMNIAMPGWLEAIQGIILQYNQGKINASTAAGELVALRNLVFTSLQKYNHMAGVDWSGGGSQPGLSDKAYWKIPCDKHCTIGCCLFNNVVGPATNNAIALVLHQQLWVATKNGLVPWQKSFTIPATPPMAKYGYVGTSAVPLSVNK
jgi:hypothetical protein